MKFRVCEFTLRPLLFPYIGFKLCMQKKKKKRLPITFGNLKIWNKAFENGMQLLVISLFVVSDKADKIIPKRQFYTELMF